MRGAGIPGQGVQKKTEVPWWRNRPVALGPRGEARREGGLLGLGPGRGSRHKRSGRSAEAPRVARRGGRLGDGSTPRTEVASSGQGLRSPVAACRRGAVCPGRFAPCGPTQQARHGDTGWPSVARCEGRSPGREPSGPGFVGWAPPTNSPRSWWEMPTLQLENRPSRIASESAKPRKLGRPRHRGVESAFGGRPGHPIAAPLVELDTSIGAEALTGRAAGRVTSRCPPWHRILSSPGFPGRNA
jgi:hypothetical protein